MDVTTADVQRAKRAVRWDDETPDELADLFDGTTFEGSTQQLRTVRSAMKRYEDFEAGIGEDKAMYDSRLALQFI